MTESTIINAGTIVGPHHRRNNEENQDSLYYRQESEYTVIAAADGAGSLKNSKMGADLASYISVEETLRSLLENESIDQSLQNGVQKAREELLNHKNSKTMGCTLALAVHSPDGWGVALVGDAFAIVSESFTEHRLIHRKPDSEYTNITKLLTSDNYDPLYITDEDEIVALSVATDGLTNLSVNIAENLASPNFWTPLITRASENTMNVEAFLKHLDTNEKLYDDTTLVIATI